MTDRKEREDRRELWLRRPRHLPLQSVHLQELQLLTVRDRRRPRSTVEGASV